MTFKAHDPAKGGKLAKQMALGDPGIARQAADKKPPGRPSLGEPWKELGISRATYFRRNPASKSAHEIAADIARVMKPKKAKKRKPKAKS